MCYSWYLWWNSDSVVERDNCIRKEVFLRVQSVPTAGLAGTYLHSLQLVRLALPTHDEGVGEDEMYKL